MTGFHRISFRRAPLRRRRNGAIVVLALLFLVVVLVVVTFAVDIGYLMVAKADLQRAADAAAHAAVLEYRSSEDAVTVLTNVRNTAKEYVEKNSVLSKTATVDLNMYNADMDGDIVVGRIDFDEPHSSMAFGVADDYNAVRVRVRRSADMNGEVPLFFAHILGYQSLALEAESTAAIMRNVNGFRSPGSGENVPFLPITIQKDYFENTLAQGIDEWSVDPSNETISLASDGYAEVDLCATDTGAAGNFGMLNVGVSENSMSHVANQIRNGLSPSDLAFHGGELALNDSGVLSLTGNTGQSANVKADLDAIKGKAVAIPLYRDVSDPGNNAVFNIVQFVGVRIVAINLTGDNKYLLIQPTNLSFKGTLQSSSSAEGSSQRIYSPPVIVR